MPFSGPKWPIWHEQFFFGTNHYYYFHLSIGPFHCAKCKKNSYSESRIMGMCHFWVQNGSFAPNNFFSKKIINIIFIYLLAPFILQNFKTILRVDPDLRGCAIFGPKMAHLSWIIFSWYKQLLLLSSTYWPFHCAKFKKKSYSESRVMRMRQFSAQNGPFAPNKNFFGKLLISLSSTY